jgi:hypothetical protein
MSGAGGGERFLKASLRQSGRAFSPAFYGTRERVPFRVGDVYRNVPFRDSDSGVAFSSAYFEGVPCTFGVRFMARVNA